MQTLQFYSSRELARQMREMTLEEKYNVLIILAHTKPHLLELIRAFPLSYIEWCKEEGLLDKKFLKYYLNSGSPKLLKEEITNEYINACQSGFIFKKIAYKKCSNYYCDQYIFTPFSYPSHFWRSNLCNLCYLSVMKMGDFYRMKNYLRIKANQRS